MSIRIVITSTVKEGMTEAWKANAARATDAARNEPGTSTYRWYLSEDGQAVNEDVYDDEAAFFAHFAAATESGVIERWMGSADVTAVAVLDPVNAEMAKALEAFGAVHYELEQGF